MSWIKLNDSLNTIKGHISSLASNVLTEDEEIQDNDSTEYKKRYEEQKKEIQHLREALQSCQDKQVNRNEDTDNWNWSEDEPPENESKKKISNLEQQNKELLAQLDELDREHQQNLLGALTIKEKLQVQLKEIEDENNLLKDENEMLKSRNEGNVRSKDENEKLNRELAEMRHVQEDNSRLKSENEKMRKEVEEMKNVVESLRNANSRRSSPTSGVSQNENNDIEDIVEGYKKEAEKLEREVEELRRTIDALQNGDKSNSIDHKTVVQENQKLRNELEEKTKEISVLRSSEQTLQKVLEGYKRDVEESEKFLQEKNSLLGELQKARNEIVSYEQKSLQDEQNCERLAFILESYEKQVRALNDELEELKCQKRDNPAMDRDLAAELHNIEEDCKDQMTNLQQELDAIAAKDEEVEVLGTKLESLEEEVRELKMENDSLRLNVEDIKKISERALLELHNKYVSIVTENLKKIQDDGLIDVNLCYSDKDPQVDAFQKQIENIVNILFDFRRKCENLGSEISTLNEEKTNVLTQKNNEIEKLMRNSEMLSQELIQKGTLIKEYENEINDLSKNNELLITELEAYKNSGLQTISESNEDNVVLLESQLENANRRIEDLEKIVYDLEKYKSDEEKKLYQELLNSYDLLQIDHDALKKVHAEIEAKLEACQRENSELKSSLEKAKGEYENVEYQLTEIKINAQEELENNKNKFDLLLEENENLMMLNGNLTKELEEIKCKNIVMKEKLLLEEDEKQNLEMQVRHLTEKLQNSKMVETSMRLQYDTACKDMQAITDAKNNMEMTANNTMRDFGELKEKYDELLQQYDDLKTHNQEKFEDKVLQKLAEDEEFHTVIRNAVTAASQTADSSTSPDEEYNKHLKTEEGAPNLEQLNALAEENSSLKQRCNLLQQQLQEMTNGRNELVNQMTAKHQESVTYYNEIQRLTQLLVQETQKRKQLEETLSNTDESVVEKLTDQNNFLREKCEVLANNLLETQSRVQQLEAERSEPTEKEITLQKNIDRLQAHLIEIEEHYTQELLQSEQKVQELTCKVNELEEREKNSSTMYTSVSIRANQQVESLQSQLQMVIAERDSLRRQISDAEDQISKHAAALGNLQFVLEQFQKDKEKDIHKETERIRRRINAEKQVQEELKQEIVHLKEQLDESKQGLLAASRLSDQLENSKKTITMLKSEVSQLQEKLTKKEEELKDVSRQTDGKVDKSLVKNLFIGFVSSSNNINKDQAQILKIIATVLDFSQEDHKKLDSKQQQGSWLSFLLTPHGDSQKMTQESLSQAFIKFLENESKPREVPSLLTSKEVPPKENNNSTPRQSPLVLNEVVLPTFTEFTQNRNSSSILKNVLKDGNN